MCLIPPDGVLSGNEENYFQLAAESVAAAPAAPESAVFDASHHRVLADHLLGWLVAAVGYAGAQIIARALAAIAYALALGALFRRLGLDALDGVLAIVIFALLGQAMFGGEWLFSGVEAKIAAYVAVLAGLALVLRGGSMLGAAALFAAATWFHFLVGGFWFLAALALRFLAEKRAFRRVAAAAGLYLLLVAPLAAWVAATRLAGAASAPGMPTPDYIYSILRVPHHTMPFLDRSLFLAHWLGGMALAAGMLVCCLVLPRLPEAARLRPMAQWLALLLFYFALAFVAAAFDRTTGALGKFYLFRPASLVLLLWIAFMLALLGRFGIFHWRELRLLALVLLLPPFLLGAATRVAGDLARRDQGGAALAPVLARLAAPDAVVLVDPALEPRFFDIERQTLHPVLVLWKFVPSDDAGILDWYRRLRFRDAVFAEGCAGKHDYRFDFLLASPAHAAALAGSCGAPVAEGKGWVLLRRG
jgi:hypothetical protein